MHCRISQIRDLTILHYNASRVFCFLKFFVQNLKGRSYHGKLPTIIAIVVAVIITIDSNFLHTSMRVYICSKRLMTITFARPHGKRTALGACEFGVESAV